MADNKTNKIEQLAISTLNMARNTLVINLRFMDKAISMLKCKSTPDVDSIAVDGSNIYYNPGWQGDNKSAEAIANATGLTDGDVRKILNELKNSNNIIYSRKASGWVLVSN